MNDRTEVTLGLYQCVENWPVLGTVGYVEERAAQ